jgi:hypothetical protein
MGVRIDAARHHVTTAGVDNFGARGRVDGGADRDDRLAVDNDVGAPRMIMVYDCTAADDERGHGNSRQAIRKPALRVGNATVPGSLACNSRRSSENFARSCRAVVQSTSLAGTQ